MSFFRSLWSLAKSHPIAFFIVIVVVVPLVLGGVAVGIYRAFRGAVAKVAPGAAGALPVK